MYQMLMSTPTSDPLLQLHPHLVRKCGESTSFYPHCTHILYYMNWICTQCKRCVCVFVCLIYSPATTSSQREGDSCIAVCVFALEQGVNKLLHYTQRAQDAWLCTVASQRISVLNLRRRDAAAIADALNRDAGKTEEDTR
jgi:hypothetical protein